MTEATYRNSRSPRSDPPGIDRGRAARLVESAPVAIAHRGGAKLRPENTLVAFAHALSVGVDAIECDVRLSRDGEPVVIHDETLDRTTNRAGLVSAFTAEELATIDAGHHFAPAEGFPFRARGVGVPRLAEVFALSAGVPVIVEIKGEDVAAVGPVLEAIDTAGVAERVVVGGFSQAVLSAVRRRAPGLVTSASQSEVISALRWSYIWRAPRRPAFQLIQAPLHLRGRRVLNRSLVRVLRRAGLPVQAWIVDEFDDMRRVLDWGVTGLISDRPDRAVQVVKERSQI
jgi:glycerophosphoryl diester phosphodiesterase